MDTQEPPSQLVWSFISRAAIPGLGPPHQTRPKLRAGLQNPLLPLIFGLNPLLSERAGQSRCLRVNTVFYNRLKISNPQLRRDMESGDVRLWQREGTSLQDPPPELCYQPLETSGLFQVSLCTFQEIQTQMFLFVFIFKLDGSIYLTQFYPENDGSDRKCRVTELMWFLWQEKDSGKNKIFVAPEQLQMEKRPFRSSSVSFDTFISGRSEHFPLLNLLAH